MQIGATSEGSPREGETETETVLNMTREKSKGQSSPKPERERTGVRETESAGISFIRAEQD